MCLEDIEQIVVELPELTDRLDVAHSAARLVEAGADQQDAQQASALLQRVRVPAADAAAERRRLNAIRKVVEVLRTEAIQRERWTQDQGERRNQAAKLDRLVGQVARNATNERQAGKIKAYLEAVEVTFGPSPTRAV
ncbi:MAG: hypothetical protein AAGF84_02275 [Planctomycetota bacterium]